MPTQPGPEPPALRELRRQYDWAYDNYMLGNLALWPWLQELRTRAQLYVRG